MASALEQAVRDNEDADWRNKAVPVLAREMLVPPPARQRYDSSLADKAVRLPGLLVDRQFWQVARVVSVFLLGAIKDKLSNSLPAAGARRAQAARIRQLLLDLGPTYIKLGQALSVRRDLLPAAVAEELATLQDEVPPFPFNLVQQTILLDLGKPLGELFCTFDPVPVASASIGQVHRARLFDGRQVVVKVQRPELVSYFYRDLGYLRMCARGALLLGLYEKACSWLKFSDEFGKTLFSELDYLNEGRNADRLRFALRHDARIRIPKVEWRLSGRRVLTLEYVPGTKIDQVAALRARDIDLKYLANLLVHCYLEQVVLSGFFHADPHPGNLAVDESEHLVLYDFGMMGEITEQKRKAMAGCARAVALNDAALLAACFKDLGLVRPDVRSAELLRALSSLLAFWRGRDLNAFDFASIERDIDRLIAQKAFCLPPSLAYLLRTVSSVEGVARWLQPNFSFAQAAKPLLKKLAYEQMAADAEAMLSLMFRPKAPCQHSGETQTATGVNHPVLVEAEGRGAMDELQELRQSCQKLENSFRTAILSIWLGAIALIFFSLAVIAQNRFATGYVLIGIGALGAIIIWRVLKPGRLVPPTYAGELLGETESDRC